MTAHVGRLIFIALQVQDLAVSTRFYRDVLGVPLARAGEVEGPDERDVVRHHLVQRIIRAYEEYSQSGNGLSASRAEQPAERDKTKS